MTKQTALGRWWIAGDSSNKVAGLLEWDGDVDRPASLELVGTFPPELHKVGEQAPLILGEAEGAQYNLLECTNSGSRVTFRDSAAGNQRWVIGHVAVGYHMESSTDRFTGCFMTLDGLGGWITADELTAARNHENDVASGELSENANIPIATFELSGALVQVEVLGVGRKSFGVMEDDNCILWMFSSIPRSFDAFKKELILPLQSLVSIATGSRGSVKTAYFLQGQGQPLMFRGGTWTGQWTYISTWSPKPLFSATELQSTIGTSLDHWRQKYSKHTYAFNSLQSVPLVVESAQEIVMFMKLVSCLDSLLDKESDRRFTSDVLCNMREAVSDLLPATVREAVKQDMGMLGRTTLRERLEQFILGKPALLGAIAITPQYTRWAIQKILSTRNCAAHSNPDDCAKAATGSDLYAIQEFVRMLVNARVLELLGFSNNQIGKQFEDSYPFSFGSLLPLDVVWRREMNSA